MRTPLRLALFSIRCTYGRAGSLCVLAPYCAREHPHFFARGKHIPVVLANTLRQISTIDETRIFWFKF